MKKYSIALYLGLIIMTSSHAWADSVAMPYSYAKASSDEQYLFVMISPYDRESDAMMWVEPKSDEIKKIRRKYTQSGLYPNDGTTIPLWTVSWYAYDIELLSDGIHLVRPGPWASSYDDEAVSFFAKGDLIRSWKINQLVSFPRLMPHSVSHFEWRLEDKLNNTEGTYTITTMHGERYTFNVFTGDIVSSFILIRWIGVAVVMAIVVLVVVRKRNKQGMPNKAL